ncbi:MAG: class II aldolase/adducin family protein [Granulosicoccus sp.]
MEYCKDDVDAARQFALLRSHSAVLGRDPWQIQGAGGNTSIKQGDIMWIKASGKWLMHANDDELFVPVMRQPLLDALDASDPRAEKSIAFVVDELNPQGLRPSIETTLHAVLQQRVVIHIHCVDTIALAVRQDAQLQLSERLGAFSWVFIPYVRPGLPLSRSIASRINVDTNVLVLGNHGLVVAADSVAECIVLLESVRLALFCESRRLQSVDEHDIDMGLNANSLHGGTPSPRLDNPDYAPAQFRDAHALAFDPVGVDVAAGGSLYPDHVIFLGKGTVVAQVDEDVRAVVERCRMGDEQPPVSIVFPGEGVVLRNDATPGQQAMARCLSDVCLRVPAGTAINYLTEQQNHELLHWEAEQYRQVLNRA